MEKEITIGVSNRHIHLTKEVYDLLFDEELTKKNDLKQIGEFASNQTVTLINENYEIDNVRILGPLRSYNQIEISHNDALKFKINPPVRKSGDLSESETLLVKGPKGQIALNGVIIAQRHIHMHPNDAESLNLVDGQKVSVKVDGDKSGIMDAYIKVSDNGFMEMHIDTDDANAFLINKDHNKGTILL